MICRTCGVKENEPCRDAHRRTRKYMHVTRIRDMRNAELNRRAKVRDDYLAFWLRRYGDIFQE